MAFACPEFLERLEGAPDVPHYHLGSREWSTATFLSRAYSMSNDGWVMTWATIALTALLELLTIDVIRKVVQRKGGAGLYVQGVLCNFLNNAVLGPPLYELVSTVARSDKSLRERRGSPRMPARGCGGAARRTWRSCS